MQIGADYSRIDFKMEGFSAALGSELEQKVNVVLKENHPVKSYFIVEEEFRKREDLLRTLEVKPPVSHGREKIAYLIMEKKEDEILHLSPDALSSSSVIAGLTEKNNRTHHQTRTASLQAKHPVRPKQPGDDK